MDEDQGPQVDQDQVGGPIMVAESELRDESSSVLSSPWSQETAQDSAEVGSDHGGKFWDWAWGHDEVSSCWSKLPSKTPRARMHPTKSCYDLVRLLWL